MVGIEVAMMVWSSAATKRASLRRQRWFLTFLAIDLLTYI